MKKNCLPGWVWALNGSVWLQSGPPLSWGNNSYTMAAR
jgi:hypothetical protein